MWSVSGEWMVCCITTYGLLFQNNEYMQSVARCLQMMLRIDEYRFSFIAVDGISTLLAVLQGRVNFQVQYQLIFCLWVLTFNYVLAEKMNKWASTHACCAKNVESTVPWTELFNHFVFFVTASTTISVNYIIYLWTCIMWKLLHCAVHWMYEMYNNFNSLVYSNYHP
jgi:hypothetical protein